MHTSRYAFFFLSMIVASGALAGCGSEVEEPQPLGAPGEALWARRFGRASTSEPAGLAVDAAGNVVVAGRYYGDEDFGGGSLPSPANNYQTFVAKYDTNGKHVYSRSFGDFMADGATDVALLPDGSAIVVGAFGGSIDFDTGALANAGFGDVFVAKLGPGGETAWAKRFGGGGDEIPAAVAVLPDGGVVITGNARGDYDIAGVGPVPEQANDVIFALRLDSGGDPVWARVFPGTYPAAMDVAARSDGGAVVVGRFYQDLTVSASKTLKTYEYSTDAFVLALDGKGEHLWSHAYGGEDYYTDEAASVAVDPAGGVLVTGTVSGGRDFGGGLLQGQGEPYEGTTFLVELDAAGAHVHSRLFGGTGDDRADAVAIDAAGDVILAGGMFGAFELGGEVKASVGGEDAFVAKVRRGGEPVFLETWASEESQTGATNGVHAYRVATDGARAVYVLGAGMGTVDFGVGVAPGSGFYDQFLLKLAP
ncbi:hypothetical protein [Polyangium aurulentum]|uniref:hypothetical protein n=1 Tax=Polyangium aurulentum TaxID=2567896 RepID=UPI0010AE2E3D|nr:hypothetical protein [Polyangium aurulentum]UQA54861.1 hypothetical protein E8A73_026220 [Polyangium aurulentum]